MNDQLKAQLIAEGCDIDSVLTDVFMGNENFYQRIFSKFATTNTALGRLESAMSAGDAAAVFEAAHELKGVYGNLGLTPLYNAICEIVEPARKGSLEGLAEKLPPLKALHEKIIALNG